MRRLSLPEDPRYGGKPSLNGARARSPAPRTGYDAYLTIWNRLHPEASPLWRDDFAGLPPVHIVTAEFDPLCDEGEALFARLAEQGVSCTCQRWPGVIHGFFQPGGISQSARDLMRDVAWRVADRR
ncbi:alpha/beta hydrolase fold domain-containing protein [Atlantibacter hermannii]|nr:alpha/beta hydrolase fold domain-containing protein [Atlantibacter hermannii]